MFGWCVECTTVRNTHHLSTKTLHNVHHTILSASVEMTFAKSRKRGPRPLFVQRLVAILQEGNISLRSFSAQLGISHGSLSRLISGDIAISPKIVALVCGKLENRAQASALIEAFLVDQLNAVTRGLPKKHDWSHEKIVSISNLHPGG